MEVTMTFIVPDDKVKREQIIDNIAEYMNYPDEVFDAETGQMIPNPQSKWAYITEKVRDKLRSWSDNTKVRKSAEQVVKAIQAQTDFEIQ